MIANSLVHMYRNNSDIVDALGGVQNVFVNEAPVGVYMPWIVVQTNPGGRRERLTVSFVEPRPTLYVFCEHDDDVVAFEIAELVIAATDFYRGDMEYDNDVYLRCGIPYRMDGPGNVTSCIVEVRARSKTTYVRPSPVA